MLQLPSQHTNQAHLLMFLSFLKRGWPNSGSRATIAAAAAAAAASVFRCCGGDGADSRLTWLEAETAESQPLELDRDICGWLAGDGSTVCSTCMGRSAMGLPTLLWGDSPLLWRREPLLLTLSLELVRLLLPPLPIMDASLPLPPASGLPGPNAESSLHGQVRTGR